MLLWSHNLFRVLPSPRTLLFWKFPILLMALNVSILCLSSILFPSPSVILIKVYYISLMMKDSCLLSPQRFPSFHPFFPSSKAPPVMQISTFVFNLCLLNLSSHLYISLPTLSWESWFSDLLIHKLHFKYIEFFTSVLIIWCLVSATDSFLQS